MIQQQDSEEQFEDYTDTLSDDDIYQIIMSQQQQLQDIGIVLRFIVENMQQPNIVIPDYRPLLIQIDKTLTDSNQQQQAFQGTLEKYSKNFQVMDQLTIAIRNHLQNWFVAV